MPKYTLNFKQTDYTDVVEADTMREASEKLYQRLPYEGKEDWTPKALIRHIYKEQEPNYDQVEELEKRLPVNI